MDQCLFLNFANTKRAAEHVRDHFHWSLQDPSASGPQPLPTDYHGLCTRFDLEVVRRYAYDSNLPEMVPAILYAIVIDDAVELGLSYTGLPWIS